MSKYYPDAEPPQGEFHEAHEGSVGHDHPHFGLIYETREELFATAIPFIREGLERGEHCRYVMDDSTEAEVIEAMSAGGIDVEAERETGALSLRSTEDAYSTDGEFDPGKVVDAWTDLTREMTAGEFEGLRVAGEMTWALDDDGEPVDGLLEYESAMNESHPLQNFSGMCLYDRERFPPETLETIIERHPQVVYDNTVAENFYYVPSEDGDTEGSRQAINHQIETLIERARAKNALERREQQIARQNEQLDHLKDRLLETSPTGVLAFDASGEITLANDRAAEILGMTNKELTEFSYTSPEFEFVRPNGEPMPVEEMPVEQVWERGEAVFDMEVGATRPDGQRIWLSMNGAPLSNEDTEDVSETIFTFEDITERKQAKEELRESEERQKFLLTLSDRIRDLKSGEEIGEVCTRLLAEEIGLDRCYFVQFYPERNRAQVGPEYHSSDLEPVSGSYPYSAFPEAIQQIETETPVYDDVANDSTLPEAEKQGLLELDFGAWIGAPVRTAEKDVDRALYAVTTEPHEWTPDEVALIEETATRTWEAIERAESEATLRERERELEVTRDRLELAAQAGSVGLWTLNIEEDRLVADEYVAECYGIDPDRAADGAPIEEFVESVHEDDTERILQDVEEAIEKTGRLDTEYRVRNKKEDIEWLVSRGNVEYNGEGEPLRIQGAISDITERKERERRLERQREQIGQLKDRLLETSPTGILVVNKTGEITLANDRAAEILGLTREELVGLAHDTPEFEVVNANGEPMSVEKMPFERVRATDEAIFGIEVGTTRPNGQRVWLSVNIAPLFDESDEPTETVVSLEEITEQKQANEALSRLNDASRELMDADARAITDRAAAVAQDVLGVEYASLWHYDDEAGDLELQTVSTSSEIAPEEIKYPEKFGERAWQVFVSKEMDVDNDLPPAPDIDASEEPIRSGVIAPLGRHGIICAGSVRPDAFDATTTDLAEMVAANVKTALDRADDEQQLEAQNTELIQLNRINDIIREIDGVLVQADTREEIERVVCERLAASDLYEFAWIGETEPGTETVSPREWAGIDPGYLDAVEITTDETPTGQGPVGTALRTRELQVVEDIVTDTRFVPWRERTLELGVRSCISVPLSYEDSLYGVLTVYTENPQSDDGYHGIFEDLGETIGHAINAVETKRTLQTDSIIELGIELKEPDTVLTRLAAQASCRIEFEGFVPHSNETTTVFFRTYGTLPDEIGRFGAESAAIEEVACLSENEGTSLFKAQVVGPTLASSLLEQNAMIRSLAIEDGTVSAVVELSQAADVRNFVESMQSQYPHVELITRRTRDLPNRHRQEFQTAFEDRLTDRQQEVLRTAYLSGFFEMPRENTGQDIAGLLGVSQPTFAQHLRRGQHNLFELLFDEA